MGRKKKLEKEELHLATSKCLCLERTAALKELQKNFQISTRPVRQSIFFGEKKRKHSWPVGRRLSSTLQKSVSLGEKGVEVLLMTVYSL